MANRSLLFYKAFNETMVEYFQKTSLNGFGLLYFIRRRKYQRFFWFLFIVLGCSFATYVVLHTMLSFLENPTVTVLASQNYPIDEIAFPTIAVCSVNKLSRRALRRLANDLSRETQKSSEFWFEKFKLFAGYFDYDAVDSREAGYFATLLNSTSYAKETVVNTLKSLAPSCEDLLVLCSWAGSVRNCSHELFQLHATIAGHCCLFNYQSDDVENGQSVFYPNGTGVDSGLSLLLNTSSSDYFYADRNINGFVIQILDPYDIPDPSTGGVHEILVSSNENINLELSVVTQSAAEEARKYDVLKRYCYFDDENLVEYGDAYSQAECFSRCRTKSIRELCNCLPYYTPKEYLNKTSGTVNVYCSLAHLECLSRHQSVWYNFYQNPVDISDSATVREGLFCPYCFPLCSYNQYFYNKHRTSLDPTRDLKPFRSLLKDSSNLSLVNLYFTSPYATQYQKNVLYNWYQILSNIGGVIGISIGCSLISGFEIIYFLTYRLIENILKYNKVNTQST